MKRFARLARRALLWTLIVLGSIGAMATLIAGVISEGLRHMD
jgi:hypothetical protein